MLMSEKYKYKHCIVAFLDILGFKELSASNTNFEGEFLDLLYLNRSENSDYKADVTPHDENNQNYTLNIKPDILSFSDHNMNLSQCILIKVRI
jgi:hypothetical protein